MCCLIGALLVAMIAAWRRAIKAAIDWQPRARLAAAASAVIALAAGAAPAERHLDHYAARAQVSGRGMLAEIWAQPLCSGSPDLNGEPQIAQLK
jgi:hypothetical protein